MYYVTKEDSTISNLLSTININLVSAIENALLKLILRPILIRYGLESVENSSWELIPRDSYQISLVSATQNTFPKLQIL